MDDLPTPVRLFGPRMPDSTGATCDYTLFVGPVACYYHNRGLLHDRSRASALCLTDAQMAIGESEDLILEAIGEVIADRDDIGSVLVQTACQSAFVGIDYDAIARRARDVYGLVVIHHENCRIMLAGPNDKGLVSRRSEEGGVAGSLLKLVPENPVVEGAGLMLLNGAARFDAENELVQVARQWGFARMQCLCDWRSRAALDQARSTTTVLLADQGCRDIAEHMRSQWGASVVEAPVSYRIDEVDACYRQLDECFGSPADVGNARDRALAAIEDACAAWKGRSLNIELTGMAHPWDAVGALLDYGFEFCRIDAGWRMPMMGAQGAIPDPERQALERDHPGIGEVIVELDFMQRRQAMLAQQGPGAAAGGRPGRARAAGGRAGMRPTSQRRGVPNRGDPAYRPPRPGAGGLWGAPAEGEFWGYRAIEALMQALSTAAGGAR